MSTSSLSERVHSQSTVIALTSLRVGGSEAGSRPDAHDFVATAMSETRWTCHHRPGDVFRRPGGPQTPRRVRPRRRGQPQRHKRRGDDRLVPRSDDGVVGLLDRLEADREEVRRTDIEELEAEIDDAVYDLFDLTEAEREVVEDYLDVF